MDYSNSNWVSDESEYYNSELKNKALQLIAQSLATCSIAIFDSTDIFLRSGNDGIHISVGETDALEEELGKLFAAVISACSKGVLCRDAIFHNTEQEYDDIEDILDDVEEQIKNRELENED